VVALYDLGPQGPAASRAEGKPVAVPFDFTPQTCGQIVENFERLYAAGV